MNNTDKLGFNFTLMTMLLLGLLCWIGGLIEANAHFLKSPSTGA